MNRRNFLRAIGVGVAAVYLRISPEKVRQVPVGFYTAQEMLICGYVDVPYMPIYFTRAVALEDFKLRFSLLRELKNP